jgi:hypothetical protein
MENATPSFSRKEQRIYLWFHNCPCGGEQKLLGRTVSTYKGSRLVKVRARCTQCGQDATYTFDGRYDPEEPPEPGCINPPESTSALLDPIQWLHAAMHFLHLTEDGESTLAARDRQSMILDALGCVREAIKFVPREGDEIPRSALKGKLSRQFARQNPDILKRPSIESIHERLVALAESFDVTDSASWWTFWQKQGKSGE